MILMLFGKPTRRKGTEMQVLLEFSPLSVCSGLLKSKFSWEFPGFVCIFACSEGAVSGHCWGWSRCLSCWTANGPSTQQTGSSFPHILPRHIIQIVPYSLCTFSLSNEWHFRLLSEFLLLYLITQLLCWSGSESVFAEHGYFFPAFFCTH